MIAAQTLADVAAALLLNATAREQALATSERFHYNALHDPLTGLPNRLLLQERMQHAALRSQRAHTFSAVLFLDLDRFKQVNDDHGHLMGDQLLRSVAHRLSGLVRSGDTLARFSGDEFVFFCEELRSEDDVAILVGRIDQTFSVPFELEGVQVAVRASIGWACAGPGETITSDLIDRADHDMYRAKREGISPEIIHISNRPFGDDDESLEVAMRGALIAGRFEVAYQPVVRPADGGVTGVEALLRWPHTDRGPLPALLMVSVAERSELICEIGTWVLEQACHDHARWLAADPGNTLDLAVNVSVRQLMKPDFCQMVSAILDRTGMDARSLVLELTESIVIEPSAQVAEVLIGMNDLGVRLALDDFGTGFSSLSYLNRLPIQIVKIDRALIAELDQPTGRIVVAAVTALAHELGLTVVAEGIETEAQRNETQAAGCDYAQGYFFARPMPADSIQKLLVA
jgi:diguanylate cyclase (GGDEF)-like protein